jgi:DNA-directed RNA polymerase specialized sigma24 family protein
MDQRCIPRIECLEPRQVLNGSLALGPALPPPPPSAAVVQVPASLGLIQAEGPAGDWPGSSLNPNQGPGVVSPTLVPGSAPGPAVSGGYPPVATPPALPLPVGTAEEPGNLKPGPAAAGLDPSPRRGEEGAMPPVVDQGTMRQEERRPQGKSGAAPTIGRPAWAPRPLASTEKGVGTGRSETRPVAPPVLPSPLTGSTVSGSARQRPEGYRPLAVGRLGQDPTLEKGGGSGDTSAPPPGEGFASAAGVCAEALAAPSNPPAWAGLLTTLWATPLRRGTSLPQAGEGGAGPEGLDGGYLPPLYLGTLPVTLGQPHDPVDEGYRFLCNYSRHAIRAAERRVGPLTDHEDIVQQICLEWLEKAGPPATAFPRLLEQAPAEMGLLRETVSRVIARVAYQQRKGRATNVLTDCPAPERATEREWAEFKSDCEHGVGNLSGPEWQILELRRQGQTFAEVGAAVGLPKQRVWELYQEVVARLQGLYREAGGGGPR